jgi:hypothetical protein
MARIVWYAPAQMANPPKLQLSGSGLSSSRCILIQIPADFVTRSQCFFNFQEEAEAFVATTEATI